MTEFEKRILDFLETVKIKHLTRTRESFGVTFEYIEGQCETFYILHPSDEFQGRLWVKNGN